VEFKYQPMGKFPDEICFFIRFNPDSMMEMENIQLPVIASAELMKKM